MNHIPGKFVWYEHVSADTAKAREFYEALFGWTTQLVPVGEQSYGMIVAGSEPIGGYRTASAEMRSHWISYLSVDDVDASYAKALAAGATGMSPPADHGSVGRGAAISDPTGAALCLWRGAESDRPDVDTVAPGDWYWNELWTHDAESAVAFYETAFGFTRDAMDMGPTGTYYLLKIDDKMRAGVMQSSTPSTPSMWLPYVRVADCDAGAARAEQLGARIVVPPSDIPGVGRFAVLIDPQNAAIAIIKGFDPEPQQESAASLLHSLAAEVGLTHGI